MESAASTSGGPTTIGVYRVLRRLGEGGMGAVYEAEHSVTRRRVALKTLLPEHAGSTHLAARLFREARAASQVGHPNICEVLDAGTTPEGVHFLALELLRGRDFETFLEEGGGTVEDVWRVGCEVLEALSAAHAAGIVHRDVKPANIFLDERETPARVKLLDFGIAREEAVQASARLTVTGTVMGTPHYMAPEQARGVRVDARADLWSVGAMLYRALTGEPPFDAENYNVLILRLLTEEPPRIADVRPDLPEPLRVAIDGALRPSPDARWKSAAEMLAVLSRGAPVPAAEGQRWARAPDVSGRWDAAVPEATRPALGTTARRERARAVSSVAETLVGPGTSSTEPAPDGSPARAAPPTGETAVSAPRPRAWLPWIVALTAVAAFLALGVRLLDDSTPPPAAAPPRASSEPPASEPPVARGSEVVEPAAESTTTESSEATEPAAPPAPAPTRARARPRPPRERPAEETRSTGRARPGIVIQRDYE